MAYIILSVILLVLISEGVGAWSLKTLKIEAKGFTAPIGFAMLLCVLQALYYPSQLWNLSFTWIIVVSCAVLAAGIVLTCMMYKEVWKHLFSKDMIVVIICAGLFLQALSKSTADYANMQALQFISGNINAAHLNLNLQMDTAGWLFQGYYHFASFICWALMSLQSAWTGVQTLSVQSISTVGLGLMYSLISSMLIINLVRYLRFRNHWLGFCILIFSLLFTNFYYWKVTYAFSGDTYRSLLLAMMLYVIYRWCREDNEQIKYLLLPVMAAGLAVSSSFLFLSLEVQYCLAAFMFKKQKSRSLFDMFSFLGPTVAYGCAVLAEHNGWLALALAVLYGAFLFVRYQKHVRRIIWRLEDFLFEHAALIFYILIPIIAVAGSLAVYFFVPDLSEAYGYARYFSNFKAGDSVKDYLFIYSDWLDNILNALRWIGVVLLFVFSKTDEDHFIKSLFLLMGILFLNPLCIVLLSSTMTGTLCYRAFEIVFNPFTEILILYAIYKVLEWQPLLQWVLELFLIAAALISTLTAARGYTETVPAVMQNTECNEVYTGQMLYNEDCIRGSI